MRVRVTTAPWAGQEGTVEAIDGAYYTVRLDSSVCDDDVQELYPNEFVKLTGDECCEGGFHCPACGGHHFGTDSQNEGAWVVYCHNEYGACGWSGSYSDHVSND